MGGAGESKEEGRGGQESERKTPESEAMIWLLLLYCHGKGEKECEDTERERKGGERKRESLLTRPQGAMSSPSFFLPLFSTSTPIAHTQNIHLLNKMIQNKG